MSCTYLVYVSFDTHNFLSYDIDLGDSSPSFRRQNLALATTGVASSL